MKAKVKLNIEYEGPITFSKEISFDYNYYSIPLSCMLDHELRVFLFNIKSLSQSFNYWNIANYEITV